MAKQRNTDGRFTTEHTDEEILAAVRAHEPAATSEVADEVGMTRQGADRRLRSLRDEGRVNGKKIAASRVWFTGGAPEPTDRIDGVEWEEKRHQTLTRDDYTCQECGADVSKTGIEIHHKTPLAGGGDNSLSNLETLCPDCHNGKHSGVPPEAVLDVFDALDDTARPLTASDVVDELDIARRTAHNKLNALVERGVLETRKVGARGRVWWVPHTDAGQSTPASVDTDAVTTADSVGGDTLPTPDSHATDELQSGDVKGDIETSLNEDLPDEHTGTLADVVDAVAEDTLPGSGAKLEARHEALHAAVEYLREHGQATPPDFQKDVYPEHTGRYTEGDDPAYSWWTNCIYKGLRELAEQTEDVEKADTTGEWSYRGGE